MKSTIKIMVVDDDPCFLRFIKEVVGDAYDLFFTTTGEEALDGFSRFQPDILLLDVVLPGISGIEVCKRIRAVETFLLTFIIMVSARAMENDKISGYRAGADHYLTKPIEPNQLLSLIQQYIVKKTNTRLLDPLFFPDFRSVYEELMGYEVVRSEIP